MLPALQVIYAKYARIPIISTVASAKNVIHAIINVALVLMLLHVVILLVKPVMQALRMTVLPAIKDKTYTMANASINVLLILIIAKAASIYSNVHNAIMAFS